MVKKEAAIKNLKENLEIGGELQAFTTILKKPDIKGSLTLIELPFNPAQVFNVSKGTIKVYGTINGKEYRNKLISRGNGLYVMTVDKTLQKGLGFIGDDLEIKVTMSLDEGAMHSSGGSVKIEKHTCDMDILTAIKTRRSIRRFISKEVERSKIETILEAGFCAPTAKNKRPWYFIVTRNKDFMENLINADTGQSNYISLHTADTCIIVCGDKNIQGINEFLLEDCSAATQNILLAAHGLELGATWCCLPKTSERYKYVCNFYSLREKVIPMAIVTLGYPAEEKEFVSRYDETKVHWEI